jgi:L-rhamnose isomerase/sugar isomerase
MQDWRRSKGLAADPLRAFRESGYLEKVTKERAEKNRAAGGSYA